MSDILQSVFTQPEEPDGLWSAWSEHIAPFFDLSQRPETNLARPLAMQSFHLGTFLAGEVRAPAQNLVRDAAKVLNQEVDHVLLQFYTKGRSHIVVDGRRSEARAGQALIYDLSRPVEVASDHGVDAVNIVLPRILLSSRSGDLSDLHGTTFDIQKDAPSRLFFTFVRELVASLRDAPPSHVADLTQVASTLCCASLPSPQSTMTSRSMRDVRLGLDVRDFIRANFATRDLDADSIADRFGLSRSTLYRQFATDGGVHAYIRERRLRHAVRLLRMPGTRQRVSSVAYACGFADEHSFSRAFKARFGVSPRDAKAGEVDTARLHEGEELTAWIQNLEG